MFFFFNDTATTEIYTLSLHDALPISALLNHAVHRMWAGLRPVTGDGRPIVGPRSEEHTSELQSQSNLVCRLLLEKKKAEIISTLLRLIVSLPIRPFLSPPVCRS